MEIKIIEVKALDADKCPDLGQDIVDEIKGLVDTKEFDTNRKLFLNRKAQFFLPIINMAGEGWSDDDVYDELFNLICGIDDQLNDGSSDYEYSLECDEKGYYIYIMGDGNE